MKVYSFSIRNRFAATLVFLALVGLGAAVVIVGFTMLAGLAAAGAVVGTGAAIINRIRGRVLSRRTAHTLDGQLDPALEVFPNTPPKKLGSGE